MADHTPIEWTDATWNPITGCSVVSPGCTNCYAMKLAGGRLKHIPSRAGLTQPSKAGPVWTGEVRFNEQWLDQPLRWFDPRRIFVCAHGDLFHENVPDAWIDRVFAAMALTPHHTFQVLTKRSARMRAYVDGAFDRIVEQMFALTAAGWPTARDICALHGIPFEQPKSAWDWWPLRNVWLGVSVEDQARADERVPDLMGTLAAVRYVSGEPLLEAIDFTRCGRNNLGIPGDALRWPGMSGPSRSFGPRLDWVIVGGESGPGARPMHPDWARHIRDACAAADVAFFFKQWGSFRPGPADTIVDADGSGAPFVAWPDGTIAHGRAEDHGGQGLQLHAVGKKAAGRLLDGVTHDAMPAVRA